MQGMCDHGPEKWQMNDGEILLQCWSCCVPKKERNPPPSTHNVRTRHLLTHFCLICVSPFQRWHSFLEGNLIGAQTLIMSYPAPSSWWIYNQMRLKYIYKWAFGVLLGCISSRVRCASLWNDTNRGGQIISQRNCDHISVIGCSCCIHRRAWQPAKPTK